MRLLKIGLLALSILLPQLAAAQAYPSKPIRMVVPFSPGAGTDAIARIIGQKMSESLGQPIVVDNRPGAGGTIGTEVVAKAPGDGYTILFAPAAHAINPSLYPKLGYDTLADFTAISMVASLPIVLGAEASVPARSFKELVALAKARPGKLTIGSAGNGTVFHLLTEMLKKGAAIDVVHVPFKGGALAMAALAGGQVNLAFETFLTLQPHIRTGKVVPLATAAPRRLAALPDVPTLTELGLAGMVAENWYAMHAPSSTPQDIIRRLNAEVAKATGNPDVREKLAAQGAEIRESSPEQAAAFVKEEVARWARVAKDAGARIE
jgi:tripartite-type tricarboxylate transporter receptor subunit TctC